MGVSAFTVVSCVRGNFEQKKAGTFKIRFAEKKFCQKEAISRQGR